VEGEQPSDEIELKLVKDIDLGKKSGGNKRDAWEQSCQCYTGESCAMTQDITRTQPKGGDNSARHQHHLEPRKKGKDDGGGESKGGRRRGVAVRSYVRHGDQNPVSTPKSIRRLKSLKGVKKVDV